MVKGNNIDMYYADYAPGFTDSPELAYREHVDYMYIPYDITPLHNLQEKGKRTGPIMV